MTNASESVKISCDACTKIQEHELLSQETYICCRDYARPTYRCDRFWLLEDLAQVRSVAISISSIGWENAEAFFAASSSTWVSFSATVDTASTTTSRRMDQVKLVAGLIKHLQRRDAEPTSLKPNKIKQKCVGAELCIDLQTSLLKLHRRLRTSLARPNSAPPLVKVASW